MDARSGTSHSITFAEPVSCSKIKVEDHFTGYGVYGSPADCVKLGCLQLCDGPVDLIVSGINHGANVGINIHYSGTVAAALEGAMLKIPALAISLVSEQTMDFSLAAGYGHQLLEVLLPLRAGEVMNINIPPLSNTRPKGIRVACQSTTGFHEYYIPQSAEDNTVYQLAGDLQHTDEASTDTVLLSEGYITITPLQADLTHHQGLAAVASKLDNIDLNT
jgi:5'-nucleotidase